MSRNDLLEKFRIYQFVCVELNLFLDNFPEDEIAAMKYDEVSREADKVRKEYEENYGPLTNFGSAFFECPVAWTDEPWPWENR